MLKMTGIRKVYRIGDGELEVLKGLSFSLEAGEFISIMGASGAGKSTLMDIIGLLDRQTSGEYILNGRPVGEMSVKERAHLRNREIGFVFQSYNLLPRLTALENVVLPLSYRRMEPRDARRRAIAALERVAMGDRAQHRPTQLSGGQSQRVAIARAIVGSPTILLADEPTGALDSAVGQEIMELFKRLNREEGITVIIVTHDPGVAAQCGRQLVLKDGRLVRDDHTPSV